MAVNRRHLICSLLVFLFSETGAEYGYFWHVTDVHYDFSYHGNQYSCHGVGSLPNPGQFGDYWCDSPWSLVNNSVHAMASLRSEVDFIIWTGDTILHGSDDVLSYELNSDVLDKVTNLLKDAFPNKTVYSAFGNHDYYPTNQFPAQNNQLYNDTLARWRDWIHDSSQDGAFLKGGYYTLRLPYGPRLVSLNTNLYYTRNAAVVNITDPADQLSWLRDVLEAARNASEKVLVIAHIAPGVHAPDGFLWFYPDFNTELLAVLTSNSDVISGMFFGHDHADSFKVLAGDAGKPSIPMYIAPSVTPWRYTNPSETGPAHNPAVRLLKYDKATGAIADIYQYYLNLPKANTEQTANWELEYQATKDYGISDLSAPSLTSLIERMKRANSAEFTNYWAWMMVNTESSLRKTCDASCHVSAICGFTRFNMVDYNVCKINMINTSARFEVNTTIFLIVVFASMFWM